MEKKNTMLLTIIAVAILLVAVVGATFAYFASENGASGSTTVTVTTETIGAITVSNEDPALYLDLTAAQMQEGITGSYWATKIKGEEPATNYASADKAVIAKLNVSGGGEETVYSCNFKITVDKTDVTLAYGDAAVVFALENNAEILGVTSGSEIDYTTLLNEYTVNFTRVGDTEEDLPLVSVSMKVTNTEVEQGFAGETLTTTFTSSDLECEIVDEIEETADTSLVGSYRAIGYIPTTETAIYVDLEAMGYTVDDLGGTHPDGRSLSMRLLQEYGIIVDSSTAILGIAPLQGVTPWLYTEADGEIIYFGCALTYWSGGLLGDTIAFAAADFEAATDEEKQAMLTEFAAYGWEFSIHSEPDVSDEWRTDFLLSHAKIDSEARDYYTSAASIDGELSGLAAYNTTWEEFLAGDFWRTQLGGVESPLLIYNGLVYYTDGTNVYMFTYNGEPVKGSDIMQKYAEYNPNKIWEYNIAEYPENAYVAVQVEQ